MWETFYIRLKLLVICSSNGGPLRTFTLPSEAIQWSRDCSLCVYGQGHLSNIHFVYKTPLHGMLVRRVMLYQVSSKTRLVFGEKTIVYNPK